MRKRRRSLKCEKVGPVLEEQRHRISRKRVRKLNFHAGKSEKSTVVTEKEPGSDDATTTIALPRREDALLLLVHVIT